VEMRFDTELPQDFQDCIEMAEDIWCIPGTRKKIHFQFLIWSWTFFVVRYNLILYVLKRHAYQTRLWCWNFMIFNK
jgi:hypothetical protein